MFLFGFPDVLYHLQIKHPTARFLSLPAWEEIPDEAIIAAKPGGLNRWTIPHTEITLVRLKEGLHEGNWVFNSETDERAPEFYEQVKQMPYKPGASEGLYQLFVSEPGWMIPRSWIRALPGWLQARHGLSLMWGTRIYLFGLVMGGLRWAGARV